MSAPPQPPSRPDPAAHDHGARRSSAPLPQAEQAGSSRIVLLIVAAVALFVGTEAILYYRWATMREPTCELVVNVSEPLRGAEIEVKGPWAQEPYKSTVGDGGRYSLPFYLEPGTYTVRITQSGRLLYEQELELTRSTPRLMMDAQRLQPAPATTPAGGRIDPAARLMLPSSPDFSPLSPPDPSAQPFGQS